MCYIVCLRYFVYDTLPGSGCQGITQKKHLFSRLTNNGTGHIIMEVKFKQERSEFFVRITKSSGIQTHPARHRLLPFHYPAGTGRDAAVTGVQHGRYHHARTDARFGSHSFRCRNHHIADQSDRMRDDSILHRHHCYGCGVHRCGKRKSFTKFVISSIILRVICARSSVDRAPASGAGCVGSIPIGRIKHCSVAMICGRVFLLRF